MPLWTPGFLGPTVLKSWLKADAITGKSDGDAVASWVDSSGNGKVAANATGAEQPLYKTNVQNSLPVVRGDGSDDDMLITAIALAKPCTSFVVFKTPADTTADQRVFSGSSNNLLFRMHTPTANDAQMNAGTAFTYSGSAITTSAWQMHLHVWNGASSRAAIDGGTPATGDTGVLASCANIALFGQGAGQWADIDIGEIGFIAGAVSTTVEGLIFGYLANKWGLTANLPGGHPYKSAAPLVALSVAAAVG